MQIYPIKESDFEQLVLLFKEFSVFQKLPHKMTNSLDQMIIEKDYIQGFVAKNETDDIMGYVTVFFSYYTWSGKSLYMDDLYVREKYRGKGIGSLLINEAKLFAQQNSCKKLRWQVSNWNTPAINFYKSLGAEIDDLEMNCDLML